MPQTKPTLYPEVRNLCLDIVRCYVRNPRIGPHWMALGIKTSALPGTFSCHCIQAIEAALSDISLYVDDKSQKEILRELILDSCIDGRDFKYSRQDIHMSKASFYRHRWKFIITMARYLGLTHSIDFGHIPNNSIKLRLEQ